MCTGDILDANDKLVNTANKVKNYILWLKVVQSAHTDSPPLSPLSIPTLSTQI
jgi:hypothetical protein